MLGFVLFVFTLIVNIARVDDREPLAERQGGRAVTLADDDQRERNGTVERGMLAEKRDSAEPPAAAAHP